MHTMSIQFSLKTGCVTAQGIHNHIRIPRVIVNLQIIILDQFQPSSLAHV
jgi:hypothetical protein